MSDEQPSVQAKMKMLQAANRGLIRAEKRHTEAAKVMVQRGVELGDARRALRLALESLQPELPAVGELPPAISSDDCVRR